MWCTPGDPLCKVCLLSPLFYGCISGIRIRIVIIPYCWMLEAHKPHVNLCIILLTFYDHRVFTDDHSFSTANAIFKTAPFLRRDMACKLLTHLTSFEYWSYVLKSMKRQRIVRAETKSVLWIRIRIFLARSDPESCTEKPFRIRDQIRPFWHKNLWHFCSVVLLVFSYIHISLENLINVLKVLLQSFDIYIKITCKFQGRIRIPEADPDPELPWNQYPDQDYSILEPQTLEPITIVFVSGI